MSNNNYDQIVEQAIENICEKYKISFDDLDLGYSEELEKEINSLIEHYEGKDANNLDS